MASVPGFDMEKGTFVSTDAAFEFLHSMLELNPRVEYEPFQCDKDGKLFKLEVSDPLGEDDTRKIIYVINEIESGEAEIYFMNGMKIIDPTFILRTCLISDMVRTCLIIAMIARTMRTWFIRAVANGRLVLKLQFRNVKQ